MTTEEAEALIKMRKLEAALVPEIGISASFKSSVQVESKSTLVKLSSIK